MARTWTLHQTVNIGAGLDLDLGTKVTNAGNNRIFFMGEPTHQHIWEYDGEICTDLGLDAFFAAQGYADPGAVDLAWFRGDLYVAINQDETTFTGATILRWDGINWAEVYELWDETPFWMYFQTAWPNTIFRNNYLAADDDRIVACTGNLVSDRLFMSTDGDNWARQQFGGAELEAGAQVIGKWRQIATRNLIATRATGAPHNTWYAIQYVGGGWVDLPAAGSAKYPLGYLDAHSFFAIPPANYHLHHSQDWGVNSVDTNFPVQGDYYWVVDDIGINAQLALYKGDTQVYEWNAETEQFDAGQDLGVDIYDFFWLSNTVYLLAGAPAGQARIYSGGTFLTFSEQFRLIDMAADSKNLYLTCNDGGTLKMLSYNRATLSYQHEVEAGAAGFNELDNRTRGIFPVVKPGADIVFLRGRDGDDVKIQYSDDYGISLNPVDDAGWAADKYAVCLWPDPLIPDDFIVVFDDDDIYHSENEGEDWEKTADAPVDQREAARDMFRHRRNLILAGQNAGAGELDFTPNYGDTTYDISDPGLGVVNHIERSQ